MKKLREKLSEKKEEKLQEKVCPLRISKLETLQNSAAGEGGFETLLNN